MQSLTNSTSPTVSIILPVWNGQDFIEETLASILVQTWTDFEVLVIDNASTDNTIALVEALAQQDARIKLIKNVENIGLVGSLNKGLSLATGRYMARMDADDVMLPERLSTQVAYMEKNPNTVAVGCWAEKFDAESGLIKTPVSPAAVNAALLFLSPMIHPSVMLRGEVVRAHQLAYRPITPVEDFDMWVRVAAYGALANVPQVLLKYRVHTASLTARSTEHRRGVLRAVLKQSLALQLNRVGQKWLTAEMVELHARFAGHEKMTVKQVLLLPFWLLWLLVFTGNMALIRVGAVRCAAYMCAALKGKLVPPPQNTVQDISHVGNVL